MKIKGNPECDRCELHKTARTVCVMGSGPVPADVMLIGEAPGGSEDEKGKPFQGRAGKVLNVALAKAGLKRSDVYITNVVKCRPPGNRKPNATEMRECKLYLEKELRKVQPKYVILLGAYSLKGVLRKSGISEMRGQIIHRDGIKYMPTFHPAAALYDPKQLGPINEDFKRFSYIVKGKEIEKPKLNIVEITTDEALTDCLAEIRKSRNISFDVETTGLDPRAPDGAAINTVQIATRRHQWVLPCEIEWGVWKGKHEQQKRMIKLIGDAFEKQVKKGAEISAHNGKFDNQWLQAKYGVTFPLTFDTMVAAHLLDENQPSGLKYLARVDCGAPDWDIEAEKKRGSAPISKEKFYEYGCLDVFYTRRLAILYRSRLRETDGLTELFRWLAMPAARLLERIESTGYHVNLQQMGVVRRKLQKEMHRIQRRLERYAAINWSSPDQVANFLFKKVGLTPLDKTPGGKDSTSESVMKRLADKHPVPRLLLEFREKQKLLSTYVDGWKELMHGDRIYFGFKLTGTVTGRLASRLHQIPRDPLIRSLIDAPEGWVFWCADFSQIELRIAAMMSGDPALLEVYQKGGDVHLATASHVMGVPTEDITKEQRKMAKAVNFGLIYGMSYGKLVIYSRDNYEIDMSRSEAKRFRNGFFARYNRLPDWHDRQRRLVRGAGEVRNPIGRIRRLPDINSEEESRRAEAERQAINSPVQGFASDLKLMAMVELGDTLDWSECVICGEHHDALQGMVRRDKMNKWLPVIKRVMESPKLLKRFGVKLPVPIEVDIEVGPWNAGKKWGPKHAKK